MTSSDEGGPVEFPRFEAGPPSSHASSPAGADESSGSPSGTSSSSHRRTISGNSLLSRLPFLRTDSRGGSPSASPVSPDKPGAAPLPTSPAKKHARTAQAPPPPPAARMKARSRKGSLRKAALLSTGRVRLDRRGLGLETIASPRLEAGQAESDGLEDLNPGLDEYAAPHGSHDWRGGMEAEGRGVYGGGGGSGSHHTPQRKGSEHDKGGKAQHTSSEENLVPKAARASRLARHDVSTTDEDEALDGGQTGGQTGDKAGPDHDATYFSAKPGILRHRSSKNAVTKKSPLGTMPMDGAAAAAAAAAAGVAPGPDEWDYAATEWWGWVILVLTWSVFVVGMGSCFGVWSWAWDVGETPYAPPELEDDATLPIVGYYPALIILTGVTAWVWVIIAWVGMKYFKHAKIAGEDV